MAIPDDETLPRYPDGQPGWRKIRPPAGRAGEINLAIHQAKKLSSNAFILECRSNQTRSIPTMSDELRPPSTL